MKRASILNQSRYFHVVDGLDLDVMHNQLEGVLPLEVKLLLKKFIQEEAFFTLETMNERIKSFDFGSPDMCNKPSPIKQQALITDSASLSQSGEWIFSISNKVIYDKLRLLHVDS